jgi:hypothetical protein
MMPGIISIPMSIGIVIFICMQSAHNVEKYFIWKMNLLKSSKKKMSAYYGIDVDTSKTIIVGRCKECQETV